MFLLADAGLSGLMAIALANTYAACWAWERNSLAKRINALEAKIKSLEPSSAPR